MLVPLFYSIIKRVAPLKRLLTKAVRQDDAPIGTPTTYPARSRAIAIADEMA